MEDAKEDLIAAILQAKKCCVSIQQKAWNHEKLELRPGENIYVRRYLYGVILSRRIRYYNGFGVTDVPKSKNLTRIFMEQRYHRSKQAPPSQQNLKHSEPKVSISDSTNGIVTKVEYTEIVEESSLLDLIDNDLAECDQLNKKLPSTKKSWEHEQDIHMQILNDFSHKGAVCRMGEHLYGFDNIRDLSFQVAVDVDRFFGREPHTDLLYKSPYHLLSDYVKGCSLGFFKSSLSKSAHDLSEWQQNLYNSPTMTNSVSHDEFRPISEAVRRRSENNNVPINGLQSDNSKLLSETRSEYSSIAERRSSPRQSFSSFVNGLGGLDHDTHQDWRSQNDQVSSYHTKFDYSSISTSDSGNVQIHDKLYQNSRTYLPFHDTELRNSPSFECNRQVVKDLDDPPNKVSSSLALEPDNQPTVPRHQLEESMKSTTTSRQSTVDYLSFDHDIKTTELRSPVSVYSDIYLMYPNVRKSPLMYKNQVKQDEISTKGIDTAEYQPQPAKRTLQTESRSLDNGYSAASIVDNVLETTDSFSSNDKGNYSCSEFSDPETIQYAHSSFDSEATLIVDEINVLNRADEVEETHLNAYVASVPTQHLWNKKNALTSTHEDVETSLRDVESTHIASQEQIKTTDSSPPQTLRQEVAYDDVASDPEHLYDPVADAEVYHAHGVIILSEPVQRPLAVTPPNSDGLPEDRLDVEELHYAKTDLSQIHPHYDDDDHIYAEIEDNAPAFTAPIYESTKTSMFIDDLVADFTKGETIVSSVNSNIAKNAIVESLNERKQRTGTQLKEELTPYEIPKSVESKPIHPVFKDDGETRTKLDSQPGREYQIIRNVGEEQGFSTTKENNTCVPKSYQTSTPIRYDKNKYEDDKEQGLPQGLFEKETALATVAIRRMSRTNHWSADNVLMSLESESDVHHGRSLSSDGDKKTSTLSSSSATKADLISDRHQLVPNSVYDEHVYEELHPMKNRTTHTQTSIKTTAATRIPTERLGKLKPARELELTPLQKHITEVGSKPKTPTPTLRKGFVFEMAKKFEQNHGDKKPTNSVHNNSDRFVKPRRVNVESGAVPTRSQLHFKDAKAIPGRRSVQESVLAFEMGIAPSQEGKETERATEDRSKLVETKRERLISIGTPESTNLDQMELPRWSSNRSGNLDNSGKQGKTTVSYSTEEACSAVTSLSKICNNSTELIEAPLEAELTEEEPVLLQKNPHRSGPLETYDCVNFSRSKIGMPGVENFVHNGNLPHPEKTFCEENAVLRDWNPRALVRALYEVSYEPRVETKRNRFVNMEGHVEIPSDETSTVAELERHWKQLYMRTKEGRLQIFVSHCADEAPAEEIVLSGVDVDANREERTLTIHGGRDHIKLPLRVQSNVFDKWRHSLLSHAASSQIDAYVKPIPKTFQHLTERVVVLELGSCSIRGGVLTTEPSLPQSFFPAIAVRTDDGKIIVGEDAYAPEIRHHGEFVRPIQAHDPSVERYVMDHEVVRACVQKVIKDLKINPSTYKILLSIPQNIPVALIGELLTLVLKDAGFQGAAITRQPSLILYAYDVTTGVVVDIGDRLNIVPVIDGYVVESAICSIPYGATQVRESLRTTLCSNNKGLYSFQSPIEKLILRYVLEQTSYVPDDYSQEEKSVKEVNVSLDKFDPLPGMPTKFSIDNSRFLCTEGLFRPKKWGLDTKGLHQLVHEAVQMSPIDSRRTLYRNIYLAGGASLLPGLAEKLEQELAAIVPNTIHTQVHISPWRYNAAYLGAQIVASAATFSDSCVSLENLPKFLSNLQSSCF